VPQRAVVDDLAVHILVDPVAALDELDGDEPSGLPVAYQPRSNSPVEETVHIYNTHSIHIIHKYYNNIRWD